jgi:probable HAF family extracellular repeat protein
MKTKTLTLFGVMTVKRMTTCLFAGSFCLLAAARTCFAQQYTVTDLGTLGGTSSFAFGINASGQVVGDSYTTPGNNIIFHAFRTAANSPINPASDDLGTLGGTSSFAFGINASGQVVGYAYTIGDATIHAFRTAANSPINSATDDLGTLGGSESRAGVGNGVNASGQVVGHSYLSGNNAIRAFRTAANSPINPATDDLGTLGGFYSQADGINASGQVVGASYATDNITYHAFRTAANSPINPATDDLGTLGGTYSEAWAINASGQVVGDSYTTPGNNIIFHAFRTAANSPINPASDDLGTLGGTNSQAHGINASGQVVGYSATATGNNHAFLYSGGVMYDLNNLIPAGSGWELSQAYSIDDAGQIVGGGTHNGSSHAFLLTPVPVDNTPPTTTAIPSPGPNSNGWNNTDVTVNLNATDNPGGSGVKQIQFSLSGAENTGLQTVSGNAASVTISVEGITILSYFATDNAGNQETVKTLIVRIDETQPVISGLPTAACTIWPPNHKLVQVATVTATDALSGLAPGSFQVNGTSNDPANGQIVITGGPSQFLVQLGADKGLIYTLIAMASDLAGNTVTLKATCTVPHDQGH